MNNHNITSNCSIHGPLRRAPMNRNRFRPVEVNKRGNRYQLYYYSPDGQRRRLSAGSDRNCANRLAVKFTDWLLVGRDPERMVEDANQREISCSVTLKAYYQKFIKRHGPEVSGSMRESYSTSYGNMCRCPKLADTSLHEVNRGIVLDYLHLRKESDGVSNSTLNIEKAFISVMIFCAVEWGDLEHNPLRGMKKFKVARKRDIRITPEQVEALLKEMDRPRTTPNMLRMVRFAYYTGRRLEEVQALRIENLVLHDLDKFSTYTVRVKGGETKNFSASEEATKIMKAAMGNRKEGYVFLNPRTGTRYKNAMTTLFDAVRKLGFKDESGKYISFHCLRNIFTSEFVSSGGTTEDANELLGHSDIRVTQGYITRKPLSWDELPKLTKIGGSK